MVLRYSEGRKGKESGGKEKTLINKKVALLSQRSVQVVALRVVGWGWGGGGLGEDEGRGDEGAAAEDGHPGEAAGDEAAAGDEGGRGPRQWRRDGRAPRSPATQTLISRSRSFAHKSQ